MGPFDPPTDTSPFGVPPVDGPRGGAGPARGVAGPHHRPLAVEPTGIPPAPPPAAVSGNDWRQVALPPAGGVEPRLPVSVVVPYFERPRALALTLAALEAQSYPRDRFEVVVVDDGSRTPPRIPAATGLDISVVRQQRRGFGAARARNTGARAAKHDILVFLDCDIIAGRTLLEAHVRWHGAVSDALTLGLRTFVDVGGLDTDAVRGARDLREVFAGRPQDADWREPYLALTDDLAVARDGAFRATSSCTLGIRKAFYRAVGGFDESFTRYGFEDTELGYRAQVRGGLLVPIRDAPVWHQGRWATGRDGKRRALRTMRRRVEDLIAHPAYRTAAPGRTFDVPRFVVTVPVGGASGRHAAETVAAILADDETDLVVRIEVAPSAREEEEVGPVRDRYHADPRVRFSAPGGALDEFPASPFHVTVPPARVPADVVRRLHSKLGAAASATAVLDDGNRVVITRAWALHRARRTGGEVAAYGDVRSVRLGRAWRRARTPRPARSRPRLGDRIRSLLEDGARVRNARTVVLLAGWLLRRLAERRRRTT